MRRWQLQEAKQKFSEVVRRALDEGPQTVTKHGEEVVMVLSAKDYRRLKRQSNLGFHYYLMSAPDLSALDIRRSREPGREIEL